MGRCISERMERIECRMGHINWDSRMNGCFLWFYKCGPLSS